MTTPDASPPPSDPDDSAGIPPPSGAPDESPEATTSPSDASATSPPPPSETPAAITPPARSSNSSSQGPMAFLTANKMVFLVVGGGIAIVVVVVVVLLATGIFGGGGGGPSDPEDYVLEDTSAVAVVDVAAILEAPAIPAQLAGFRSLGFPNMDPEDPSDWIDAWESEWADDFPRLWDAISLADITTALLQEDADGRDLVWFFFGEFAFEDLRESLEDAGRESDTYRDFEIWGEDVAILEDRGAVLVGPFVQDVLKALDTDRGFVDETSVMKQALENADEGLALSATTTCSGSFFQASVNSCEAVVEVVMSGDAENTVVSGAYLFSSNSRAESGADDIEDAIDNQDTYDADLNQVEADGLFVSYEVSIVGEFVGGTAGGVGADTGPLSYALEDITYLGMLNVSALIDAAEIPALLAIIGPYELPTELLNEPEEWKDEWEDYWDGWFAGLIGEVISVPDINHLVVQQKEGSDRGLLMFGEFAFDDVREFLEDEELEVDTYRDFEIWDDRIALLEDRGIIALNNEDFVKDFLKALATGEGFLEDTSALNAGLYRAGEGLAVTGRTNCGNMAFSAPLRNCEAAIEIIKGGDPDTTELSAVYVFSSERRAESGLEDLEEAIEDQDRYDADIEKIEAEGELVTYDVTIHE